MALSKKGPIGYKHSLPKADSPNKVVTASGTSPASPQGGRWTFPDGSTDWGLVLPDPLGNGHPAPRWQCPGALAPDHPRTAGPRDSPSSGPRPWASNQRLVKGKMSGSPSTPGEPLHASFPLRGYHQGAPFGSSAPEDWCHLVDPPKMSICTPRATQVAPNQDPATYVQPSQAPNSLIRVQSSGSCPVVDRTDTTLDLSQ